MRKTATRMAWMALALIHILCPLETAEAEDARRPNILFAISDDQSWMHAGAYGDTATSTPAFDRVAREGVLFHHAFAASPSCAPSRSAILTGRNIWELEEGGVLFGILRSKFRIFPKALEKSGYVLGATGKTWGPGRLEGWNDGNLPAHRISYNATTTESITGKSWNSIRTQAGRPGLSNVDYASNFDAFLAARDASRPFFFWYGSFEPHQNFAVDAWRSAGKKLADARLPACLPDDPVTRGEILDHCLEIEHFDRHLGRMLASLEKAGELENTLVIVTSDHGNPLPRSKCSLYDSGTRVPLAARWPERIPGGRRVEDLVSLTDLAPTFLEAAGLEAFGESSGRSLWPLLESANSGTIDGSRDAVVTAFERHVISRHDGVGYPMRAIRTQDWAYIRNYEPDRWPAGDPDFYASHQQYFGDCDQGASKHFIIGQARTPKVQAYFELCFGRRPAEELYNLRSDPEQLVNLAGRRKHSEMQTGLAARLSAYLAEREDPRARGEAPWDRYPFVDSRFTRNREWRLRGTGRAPGPAPAPWVPIFKGGDLSGWTAWPAESRDDWSVQDGVLIAEGSEDRLAYLTWKEELRDFELTFEYRMLTKGNTGVEVRARVDESGKRPYEGYHADLGHVGIGAQVLGAWDFHFARRREPPCHRGKDLHIDADGEFHTSDIEGALELEDVHRGDWNRVHVLMAGSTGSLWINGKLSSRFTDDARAGRLDRGVIAFQLHDKGMRVAFRDIRLRHPDSDG